MTPLDARFAPDTRPILVPLDGSPLAEMALPWAARIARQWGAPVVLARVVDLRHHGGVGPADGGVGALALCDETECAATYLRERSAALRAAEPSIDVRTSLSLGTPAGELLEVERRNSVRLVVLTTHGRTGWARWARGSVAEAVLRGGAAPVLLVRRASAPVGATHARRTARALNRKDAGLRVLVGLDGSPIAEGVLPQAISLAAGGGTLTLVSVVRTRDEQAIGPFFQARVSEHRRDAGWYLTHLSAEAHAKGVPVRAVVRVAQDVAASIVDLAVRESVDLIALGTHGRGALGRLLYGSVADRVAHGSPVPVLLYRQQAAVDQPASEAAAEARLRAHIGARRQDRAAA